MSDEAKRCKVCSIWEQQSNPAEGCCDRCGNNPRKLHGYIHQIEAEAIRYQDLKTALTTMHEVADNLKAQRDELRETCRRFRAALQKVEKELAEVNVERNAWRAVANSKDKALEILDSEISAMKQRRVATEAALAPFAKVADLIDELRGADLVVPRTPHTVDEYFAARKALQ